MSKTPMIRLQLFEEDWKIIKLKDISIKNITKNTDKLYTNSFTNSAEQGIVSQEDFFDKNITNVKNSQNYYIVKPDDFVYNPRISIFAPVGPINRNNLNITGIMSPLYYIFSVHSIHLDFLETYFKTSFWHSFMYRNGDTGARSDRFSIREKVFLDMPIPYPTKEEQAKIGGFFKELDELIALQQLTIDKVKEMKRGFLQRMFPQKDARYPEIRFKGYSDKWTLTKLSSLCDVRDGTHDSPKFLAEGKMMITSKNITESGLDLVNVSYISEEDFENINKRSKVEIGDIIFGMIGTIGNAIILESEDFAIKNVALIKTNEKTDNNFLVNIINSNIFDRYVYIENAGNTQKFLGLGKIREFKFKVPNISEQIKVGRYLKELDNLIKLEQQELESLHEMKKGFLQKMFV